MIEYIVEVLKAEGWPAKPSGEGAAQGNTEIARHEYDRALALLATTRATAEQNPAFAPAVDLAVGVVDEAKRRLDLAMVRYQESLSELSRLGSRDEAVRQYCQAARDQAIKVRGHLVRELDNESVTTNSAVVGIEVPSAAFDAGVIERFGRGNDIQTPWGCFIRNPTAPRFIRFGGCQWLRPIARNI